MYAISWGLLRDSGTRHSHHNTVRAESESLQNKGPEYNLEKHLDHKGHSDLGSPQRLVSGQKDFYSHVVHFNCSVLTHPQVHLSLTIDCA